VRTDVDDVNRNVGGDASDLAAFFFEHPSGARLGALADEGDSAATNGAVNRVLGARTHGDGNLARGPTATQRALENSTDSARLTLDLRIGCTLRLAAEHDEKDQEAGEKAGDDPEDQAKDV